MDVGNPPASSPLVRFATRSGLFYGWFIVAVVFLISMVATGTQMASGVMVKPLENEFGWDRREISLALAIGLLANGLGAPFGGRLIDRFGPRLVVVGSLAGTIIATVGTITMHTIIELTWWWGVVHVHPRNSARSGTPVDQVSRTLVCVTAVTHRYGV